MSQTREPPHPCRIFRQKKEHLPHDIVLNILANLPVKSVLRFRCVSKTWDSSITTPSFISTHLNLNNNNNLAYLISFASTTVDSRTIPSFIGGYDPHLIGFRSTQFPLAFFLHIIPTQPIHAMAWCVSLIIMTFPLILVLFICGTPALENLRGCLVFPKPNIIGFLLDLLISPTPMTTRLLRSLKCMLTTMGLRLRLRFTH